MEATSPANANYSKNKKRAKLIGFALETDNEIENARKKLFEKNLDMIVLNNPEIQGAGFNTDTNKVTFITKEKVFDLELMTKTEVANKILDFYLTNLK